MAGREDPEHVLTGRECGLNCDEAQLKRERLAAADFWDADELDFVTGTPAPTWRYWAKIGEGPPSFKLGKRRVWRRTVVEQWLAEQERDHGGGA